MIDRTHHLYIIRAMELDRDVITGKPLTIDVEKCRAILDAVNRTGRKPTVTFNYRYAPIRAKVKELLIAGAIGDVKSVHFEWLLDTNHGADYFRRWHREKRNSGGLMVYKSTDHLPQRGRPAAGPVDRQLRGDGWIRALVRDYAFGPFLNQ